MTAGVPRPGDAARLAREAIGVAEVARRAVDSASARMEAAIGGGFHEHAEAVTVFLTEAYVLVDEGIEALRTAMRASSVEGADPDRRPP